MKPKGKLPYLIYELQPVIYLLAGIYAFTLHPQTFVTKAAAVVLIFAGAIIIYGRGKMRGWWKKKL